MVKFPVGFPAKMCFKPEACGFCGYSKYDSKFRILILPEPMTYKAGDFNACAMTRSIKNCNLQGESIREFEAKKCICEYSRLHYLLK